MSSNNLPRAMPCDACLAYEGQSGENSGCDRGGQTDPNSVPTLPCANCHAVRSVCTYNSATYYCQRRPDLESEADAAGRRRSRSRSAPRTQQCQWPACRQSGAQIIFHNSRNWTVCTAHAAAYRASGYHMGGNRTPSLSDRQSDCCRANCNQEATRLISSGNQWYRMCEMHADQFESNAYYGGQS